MFQVVVIQSHTYIYIGLLSFLVKVTIKNQCNFPRGLEYEFSKVFETLSVQERFLYFMITFLISP